MRKVEIMDANLRWLSFDCKSTGKSNKLERKSKDGIIFLTCDGQGAQPTIQKCYVIGGEK
jgi:hypothetical protein